MKTTGKIWAAYLDSWPEDQWFDEGDVLINDIVDDDYKFPIKDTDRIVFTGGCIYKNSNDKEGQPLISHFRKWLKTYSVKPEPIYAIYGWMATGLGTVFFGENAEPNAKRVAKRLGGTTLAFPVYIKE